MEEEVSFETGKKKEEKHNTTQYKTHKKQNTQHGLK